MIVWLYSYYLNWNRVEFEKKIEKKVYENLCWDKRHNLKLSLANYAVWFWSPYLMVVGNYFYKSSNEEDRGKNQEGGMQNNSQ